VSRSEPLGFPNRAGADLAGNRGNGHRYLERLRRGEAQMKEDVQAIRRVYADGSDTFLTTATCRQDVRFLLDRLAAAERVVEAARLAHARISHLSGPCELDGLLDTEKAYSVEVKGGPPPIYSAVDSEKPRAVEWSPDLEGGERMSEDKQGLNCEHCGKWRDGLPNGPWLCNYCRKFNVTNLPKTPDLNSAKEGE
jgi:hypothetical protein